MARYLERAENTARKIQAGLHYSVTSREENNDLVKFLVEEHDKVIFKKKYNDFSLDNVLKFLKFTSRFGLIFSQSIKLTYWMNITLLRRNRDHRSWCG